MHNRSGQWEAALAVAESLVELLPAEPIGWIYRSFALQQLGRLGEAAALLLTGAKRFPNDWRIAYNLGCYLSQLGDRAGAWNWLDRAIELGGEVEVQSIALDDPHFKPLWEKAGHRLALESRWSVRSE